jgi:hypothetical protein
MSATGYYFAYRSIYAAEGGYELSRRKLTAVVAARFGGLFDTGGIGPAATWSGYSGGPGGALGSRCSSTR